MCACVTCASPSSVSTNGKPSDQHPRSQDLMLPSHLQGLTKSKSFWILFYIIFVIYDTKSAPTVKTKLAYGKVTRLEKYPY